MKRLIILAALSALAVAKPEQYKEQEEFQYSRSSSDDGTKSGFYGAQRGNMGGNFERSHNMDSLAQGQMSGLVHQVDGELGDGAKTRAGSVFSAASSRGTYGSGHVDLANLAGRSFQEGTTYDSSHLHSQRQSSSAGYADGHSQGYGSSQYGGSRYGGSQYSGSQYSGSQYGGYGGVSDAQTQTDDRQTVGGLRGSSQYVYGTQAGHRTGYQSQSGFQEQSQYDGGSAQIGHGPIVRARVISATPVRVVLTPGGRVAVPVAAQTYFAADRTSAFDQTALTSDTEALSGTDQGAAFIPSEGKRYESSYRYHKKWEKHDTIPTTITFVSPTESTIPRTSELVEDSGAHGFGSQYVAGGMDSQSAQSSGASGRYTGVKSAGSQSQFQSGYAAQQRGDSATSYTHGGYRTGLSSDSLSQGQYTAGSRYQGASTDSKLAGFSQTGYTGSQSDLKGQVEDFSSQPKSYQSSYSYHKSWERQGDPYVIKPASSGYYDGQASQRLTSGTKSQGYAGFQSGSQYGHDQDCDESGHVRVARSYDTYDQEVQQQSQDIYNGEGQQAQSTWQNLEDLGQQTQTSWDQQSAGQQSHGQWDRIEDLGHKTQSFGQQTQGQWDKIEDLGQQSQSSWDQQSVGQETQSQWDKAEDLEQTFVQGAQNILGEHDQHIGYHTPQHVPQDVDQYIPKESGSDVRKPETYFKPGTFFTSSSSDSSAHISDTYYSHPSETIHPWMYSHMKPFSESTDDKLPRWQPDIYSDIPQDTRPQVDWEKYPTNTDSHLQVSDQTRQHDASISSFWSKFDSIEKASGIGVGSIVQDSRQGQTYHIPVSQPSYSRSPEDYRSPIDESKDRRSNESSTTLVPLVLHSVDKETEIERKPSKDQQPLSSDGLESHKDAGRGDISSEDESPEDVGRGDIGADDSKIIIDLPVTGSSKPQTTTQKPDEFSHDNVTLQMKHELSDDKLTVLSIEQEKIRNETDQNMTTVFTKNITDTHYSPDIVQQILSLDHKEHNFSKDKVQGYGQESETLDQHITSLHNFSQDHVQEVGQQSLDQHNFGQELQDFEQQSGSVDQHNLHHFGQELQEFGQQSESLDQHTFGQELQDFGQQSDSLDQHTFGQELQDFGQQSGSLDQHTFGQELQDFGQQSGSFDQHTFGQKLQEFGQQSGSVDQHNFGQELQDFGQQSETQDQHSLHNFGQELQDFGQQSGSLDQHNFDKEYVQDFGQQSESQDQYESHIVGQEHIEDVGQQSQSLDQHNFGKEHTLDLGQQSESQYHHDLHMVGREHMEDVGQQSQSLDQHSFGKEHLQDFGQQSDSQDQHDLHKDGQEEVHDIGQQSQSLDQHYFAKEHVQDFGQQSESFAQHNFGQELQDFEQQTGKVDQHHFGQELQDFGQQQLVAVGQTATHPKEIGETISIQKHYEGLQSISSSTSEQPVTQSTLEPVTEKAGFWSSVGSKFKNAKNSVYSWFKSE